MTPGTGWQPSDEFLDRVRRAYRLSLEGWTGAGRSMWTGFFDRQRPIHDALLNATLGDLRAIFSDPGATDLFYGVDNLCAFFIAERATGAGTVPLSAEADEARHLLRQCARLIGDDVEDPISAIDRVLGQKVNFPNPFRGEFGLETERGVATYRAIQALYQVHKIQQTANNRGRVLEIGPGAGRTAYYACKSGIDYTTIDLPMGVVAQACFLGAALGEDDLWLIGDSPKMSRGRIRLLPISLGFPSEQFDLVVNVDSMTEMDSSAALRCVQWIASHARAFLSINHALNAFTVEELCRAAFAGVISESRPYPMRPGYTETVFATGPARPSWLAAGTINAAMIRRRFVRRLERMGQS